VGRIAPVGHPTFVGADVYLSGPEQLRRIRNIVPGSSKKDMTVYGRPPVGAFGVDTLEHVEGAAKLGMTLIYSYSPESARKQLDLDDPMGKAVAKQRMQVMYPLCGRFTRVRLAREIGPADATIPVTGETADSVLSFPESGYQYLFLYHIPTKLFVPLAKLKSTADDAVCDGSCRVDLHPRLSRDGRTVCIDSTHEGLGRQMYVLDIGCILDRPPARR
jgi:hypothetical protein